MERITTFARKTKETEITGQLNLDGTGRSKIATGIGFLDHMLELFAFHAGFDLELSCQGDLKVCPHHSIEDIAIVLGTAFRKIVEDGRGIKRYATFYIPMDETLTRTSVDVSGRPYHVFRCAFKNEKVGEFPTEMAGHFFYSFCTTAKITLHQESLYGENDHHLIESLFKGFGRVMSDAVTIQSDQVPSSKGVL